MTTSASPFAKSLGANEVEVREKTLTSLRSWIKMNKAMSSLEMLKLWKGLFYCMWMSDKPAVQQELGRNMASLLHDFKTSEAAHLFIQSFIQTMQREWQGLDHLRLDKYYYLIRRFMYEWLVFLFRRKLRKADLKLYQDVMIETLMKNKPDGLRCHVLDVFIPELERVLSDCKRAVVTESKLLKLLEPFFAVLRNEANSKVVASHAIKQVFQPLVKTAELNIDGLEINLAEISRKVFEIASDSTEIPGKHRDQLYTLRGFLQQGVKETTTKADKQEGSKDEEAKDTKNKAKTKPTKEVVQVVDKKAAKSRKTKSGKQKAEKPGSKKTKRARQEEGSDDDVAGSESTSKRIRFAIQKNVSKTFSKSVKALRTTPIKSSAELPPPESGLLRNSASKSSPRTRSQTKTPDGKIVRKTHSLKKGLREASLNALRNGNMGIPTRSSAAIIRNNMAKWAQ